MSLLTTLSNMQSYVPSWIATDSQKYMQDKFDETKVFFTSYTNQYAVNLPSITSKAQQIISSTTETVYTTIAEKSSILNKKNINDIVIENSKKMMDAFQYIKEKTGLELYINDELDPNNLPDDLLDEQELTEQEIEKLIDSSPK